MKFSEMKYERPDLDKVLAQCEEYAKKMAAAQRMKAVSSACSNLFVRR